VSKVTKFLKKYEKLCRRYGVYLHGCGCCGSPSLVDLKKGELLAWDAGFDNVCFQEEWWHKHKDFNHDFLLKKTGKIEKVSERRN